MSNRDETVQQNQDKLVIYIRNTSWTQLEGYWVHRMCKLLNTRHLRLAAMQGIPLPKVARWMIEKDGLKGGEISAKLFEAASRPA